MSNLNQHHLISMIGIAGHLDLYVEKIQKIMTEAYGNTIVDNNEYENLDMLIQIRDLIRTASYNLRKIPMGKLKNVSS